MRLLLIAIASIVLFFPLYWLLHPLFGPDWGSGIAVFTMYIVFPALFLLKWNQPSTNPFFKVCNYLLAFIVLSLMCWIIYDVIFNSTPLPNSIVLFSLYGYFSIYFIKNGYMPYQTDNVESADNEKKI